MGMGMMCDRQVVEVAERVGVVHDGRQLELQYVLLIWSQHRKIERHRNNELERWKRKPMKKGGASK